MELGVVTRYRGCAVGGVVSPFFYRKQPDTHCMYGFNVLRGSFSQETTSWSSKSYNAYDAPSQRFVNILSLNIVLLCMQEERLLTMRFIVGGHPQPAEAKGEKLNGI